MTKWFKRSDGLLFCAAEDSADYKMMMKDGSFELIGDEMPSETETSSKTAKAKTENISDFPEGFPLRAKQVFEKLEKTFKEVSTMSREKLIEVKGISEKTADAIIALRDEK